MAKLECSKCGAIKEGSYIKESWCSKCTGERRKARRAMIRQEKDLPAWGSGRDPKCKQCRMIKEEAYKNGNLCGTCKCAQEKIRYAANIAEKGLEPRRKGRNPICNCGKPKENLQEASCSDCTNARKRMLRIKKKEDPNFLQKEREKYDARLQNNFNNRLKKNCREATHRRIQSGILIKQPCEKCGTSENIQAHHDDYSKPMQIVWLCSWHHAEHHKNVKD